MSAPAMNKLKHDIFQTDGIMNANLFNIDVTFCTTMADRTA